VLTNVAVLALDGVAPFEFGTVCEVFGTDRSSAGIPRADFAVVGLEAGPVTTSLGMVMTAPHGLDRLAEADLIAVPACGDGPVPEPVLAALRAAVDRGARVVSLCTGAFVLAQAGLLDGRRATTHWLYAKELAQRYPDVTLEPDVLYVEDGPVVTSAGTAAGIDACLHIVRQEWGAAAANYIARRMVVPPHRQGGQAQYIEEPVVECASDSLAPLLDWVVEHLDEDITVDDLARRAAMSPRTFARRFRAETGVTPYNWLLNQRVMRAQHLLESSHEPVERIADLVGFGSAALMRHHFQRVRGTTPQAYRRTFRQTA
jgi:transcriptional regulator GlxA family with amidase domain